jgi:CheY-like chemotaxis protein
MPYDGDSVVSLIASILADKPIPVLAQNREIPPALAQVVDRAIRKAPEERFPDCREMQNALEQYLADTREACGPYQLSRMVFEVFGPLAPGVTPWVRSKPETGSKSRPSLAEPGSAPRSVSPPAPYRPAPKTRPDQQAAMRPIPSPQAALPRKPTLPPPHSISAAPAGPVARSAPPALPVRSGGGVPSWPVAGATSSQPATDLSAQTVVSPTLQAPSPAWPPPQAPAQHSRPQAASGVRCKLLIVDDSRLTAAVLEKKLSVRGFEVLRADSVDAATSLLFEGDLRPDIVLLDVNMPGLNGTYLAKIIKGDPELKGTKVYLCSALAPDMLKQAAAKCSADGYVEKNSLISEWVLRQTEPYQWRG